jgi:hypothetical protein
MAGITVNGALNDSLNDALMDEYCDEMDRQSFFDGVLEAVNVWSNAPQLRPYVEELRGILTRLEEASRPAELPRLVEASRALVRMPRN